MDCSVCTSMPAQLRPPRNTICGACYEGARSLISFINKLEAAQGIDKANLCKNLMNVSTWVLDMKDSSEELDEKIKFVSGFVVAFRDQIHTDIQLRSGENRPPIPAHRALLAIRSEIFSNMLDSDGCKAPPSDDTITLPELNHEELECFLELLYSGDLAEERMSKHVYSLSLAADKYGVSFLQKLCERHMLKSLSSSNALDVLEVADTCSFLLLKENALNYIVKNMKEIVFSAKYDTFALKNPHLSVQITRASLMDARRNCVG
ncbi:BTB/POZ domain-containing protein At3g56230 isoform X1 [Rosa rugosa]|uniref:BTB/POZ domain-containing protein At3g56230 isoform X1 n=2 Tax=Rosa rugosa TaxID=74645 RepID=UPI002B4005B6|nr:BTB/POZ domain-containing protein At3g56230 isoform X1 [Rosa rugosa]